jgi:hypothetical protein
MRPTEAEAKHCTPVHRIGTPAEGPDETRAVNRRNKVELDGVAVLFAT